MRHGRMLGVMLLSPGEDEGWVELLLGKGARANMFVCYTLRSFLAVWGSFLRSFLSLRAKGDGHARGFRRALCII